MNILNITCQAYLNVAFFLWYFSLFIAFEILYLNTFCSASFSFILAHFPCFYPFAAKILGHSEFLLRIAGITSDSFLILWVLSGGFEFLL